MKTLTLSLLVVFFLAGCKDEISEKQLSDLAENEFLIIPHQPVTADQVYMVSLGCSYNILASVNVSNQYILVKKRFNSQMKWPCVLEYDTIQLGQLNKGTYEVVLQIIDINPSVTDSIFSEEKLTIKVAE
jgi:hypothetical protein